ncbi:MAG: tRNA (adenosine(37)-N6)-threonylcarbamoyltransferase complex ATPase subunit type 1 TsaE, partial [Propionibacteriaceae bacterium]
TVASALAAGGGIFATVAGAPAGSILIAPAGTPGVAALLRVAVHPDYQRHGIASAMVTAAERLAARLGYRRLELFARSELPELITFWRHRGFVIIREEAHGVILNRPLGVLVQVPTAQDMQRLGVELADRLAAGDLIIASGELGAGKTTLAQGLGAGLGSDGVIISPTFVISRVHRSRTGRPTLIHVDAYRLGSAAEIDDLDLDATAPDSITLVEWGSGLAEELADHRLEIDIRRSADVEDDTRTVLITGLGPRWDDVDLRTLTGTRS